MAPWIPLLLLGQVLQVGPDGPFRTIGEALRAAGSGDTVHVVAGTYRERLHLTRPVVLIGEGRPVIDGGGTSTVVTVGAPAVIRGFEIRSSGSRLDREDAGVLVRADSARILDNRIRDVLFGVYLKESVGTVVEGNLIEGKDRPLGTRGDGIRLWYSHDARIERNRVIRVRDVVVYFSHGLEFRHNRVEEGRYGLHYMYSDDNLFERNEFVSNDVAAFIMYSADIRLRENVFARASGRSGYGLGLKDADRIEVRDNLIVQNRIGIYLDNSPHEVDAKNWFEGNVLGFNDVGVSLMPSVQSNEFSRNGFISNLRDVEVSGGGTALANDWAANHWDGAPAWDEDRDGFVDYPYRIERLTDDLFARHPRLRVFELSPAATALDALGRFFPLLEPRAIVIDSSPRLSVERLEALGVSDRWLPQPTEPDSDRGREASAWFGGLCLALFGAAAAAAWRWPL